jgi:hypothetical protein
MKIISVLLSFLVFMVVHLLMASLIYADCATTCAGWDCWAKTVNGVDKGNTCTSMQFSGYDCGGAGSVTYIDSEQECIDGTCYDVICGCFTCEYVGCTNDTECNDSNSCTDDYCGGGDCQFVDNGSCSTCGDGTCDADEDQYTCSADCTGGPVIPAEPISTTLFLLGGGLLAGKRYFKRYLKNKKDI